MRTTLGGNLTVVTQDQWYADIRAGRAFARGGHLAASAGNLSQWQLFNPAASGVIVLVKRAFFATSVLCRLQLRTHNVALATDVGAGINLLSGGAAGLAHVRTAQPAAVDGNLVGEMRMIADGGAWPYPDWSWELPAGTGLIIVTDTVNQVAECTWWWKEV